MQAVIWVALLGGLAGSQYSDGTTVGRAINDGVPVQSPTWFPRQTTSGTILGLVTRGERPNGAGCPAVGLCASR
jgi:hypothetical protein